MKLRAEFELDEQGRPIFLPGKLKHYKIKLSAADVPDATQAVSYELHETYYDPLREVFSSKDNPAFAEEITSYGDFDVRLSASGSRGQLRTPLSKALENTYLERGLLHDQHIQEALGNIKKY